MPIIDRSELCAEGIDRGGKCGDPDMKQPPERAANKIRSRKTHISIMERKEDRRI